MQKGLMLIAFITKNGKSFVQRFVIYTASTLRDHNSVTKRDINKI